MLNRAQQTAITETLNKSTLVISGAGSGKCVVGDTMIYTDHGMLRIDEIPKFFDVSDTHQCQAAVVSYDTSGNHHHQLTSHWYEIKASPIFRAISCSGYEIAGTPEHPLLTLNTDGDLVYKSLSCLQPGDYIVVSLNNNLWGNYEVNEQEAYLMGLLTGDGCLSQTNGTIGFARGGQYLPDAFTTIVRELYGANCHIGVSRKRDSLSVTYSLHSVDIKKRLAQLGVSMTTAPSKVVPWSIRCTERTGVRAFLQGLFDTESSVSHCQIEYSTASGQLAREVQLLLLNFGIRASRQIKRVKAYPNNRYWRLTISGKALRLFQEHIGYRYELDKQNKLDKACFAKVNSNIEVLPYQQRRLNSILKYFKQQPQWNGFNQTYSTNTCNISLRDYFHKTNCKNPSTSRILSILELINDESQDIDDLRNFANNLFFDKIVSVKEEVVQTVYDFTVPDTHSFVGNGIVNHNTKVLTHRIAHLIQQKNVDPHNIIAVTFTNKAAEEMKSRISGLIGTASNILWVGTFHSICVKILRAHGDKIGVPKNFTIYDTNDSKNVLSEVLKSLVPDSDTDKLKIFSSKISSFKSNMITPQDLYASDNKENFAYAKVYEMYNSEMRRLKALDFDDLLLLTVKLLAHDQSIRSQYQERFKYILADEQQDSNIVQYEMLKLLAGENNNLFVVGDDSQSIYSFRGANINNILNFESDWPDAMVVKLEQNYRSTKNIVAAGNAIIKNNQYQKQKELYTENEQGRLINVHHANTDRDEADFIVREIRKNRYDYNKIAILYRANFQSRVIENALIYARIPYRIIGGLSFYERKEIRDCMAYLRFAHNSDDDMAFKRIFLMQPGLGASTVKTLQNNSRNLNISMYEAFLKYESKNSKNKKSINTLKDLLCAIKSYDHNSISALLKHVWDMTGYQITLQQENTQESHSRLKNINELLKITENYCSLEEFLEKTSLICDQDEITHGNFVKLMTVHASKGLEFPVVFVVGLEEKIFPHINCMGQQEKEEEERRLAYVAITRAEKHLYLSCCASRMTYGSVQHNNPSRFLEEIPKHLTRIV